MYISPDGVTVRFKTEPEELFLAEKSGAKPNLLCLMDFDEWSILKKHNPTKIIIQHQQEIFLRTLTNIHLEGEMLNMWVVTFSWTHPKQHPESCHVHVITEPDPYSPLSHSMSLDLTPPPVQGPHSAPAETVPEEPSIDKKFHAITISTQTLAILQDLAHGQSLDSAIRALHESYLNRKTSTWRPRHD
jgi:hypothetical protein